MDEGTVEASSDNPSNAELLKIGKRSFAVDRDQVKKLLQPEWFQYRTLEFIGYSETKQIESIGFEGMEKRYLFQVDGAFLASPDTESFLNNKNKLRRIRDDIPLIHASDAHRFDDGVEPSRHLGKSKTWVRCSPNFDSLAFAIKKFEQRLSYGEPDDRKRQLGLAGNVLKHISVKRPSGKLVNFDYGMDLNPGYAVVIGNRGQGKSALADWIAIAANTDPKINFAFLNSERFTPARKQEEGYKLRSTWGDEAEIEFTWITNAEASCNRVDYFPQARIEQLCSADPNTSGSKDLEQLIGDLLFRRIPSTERRGASSLDGLKNTLRSESSRISNDNSLERTHRNASSAIKRIIEIDSLKLAKKKRDIEIQISEIENGIQSVPVGTSAVDVLPVVDPHTQSALIRESETRWVQRANSIGARLSRIDQADTVRNQVKGTISHWVESLQLEASEPSELLEWNDVLTRYREQFETGFEQWFSELNSELRAMHSHMRSIKAESAEVLRGLSGADRDIHQRIESENHDNRNRRLLGQLKSGVTDPAQDKWSLDGIKRLFEDEDKNRKALRKAAAELADSALCSHKDNLQAAHSLSNLLNETLSQLNLGDGSVKVEVKVADRFNAENVLSSIKVRGSDEIERICDDRRAFDNGFTELALEDVERYMRGVLDFILEAEQHELLKKNGGFVDNFELLQYLTDFSSFDIRVELSLDGRPLAALSPGQRGLVLLLFILEADESGNVLLIDQPEDNLDNDAIKRLLIPALDRARLKRQVIVVTHNANIGVLGDPDQVISCSFDGETFSATSGSITDGGMQTEMLRVLEGAEDAFRDRARRYGLHLG
ncbi:AAA family ATPase [Corynebacterium sp. HMSC034E11]|uniref:AAA family ATPase n=1 Tax=Corynebacterium sp. HMSC034E11 TaxID=1715169 RepID=UPI00114CB668|nr:AAA family ATPase [Corynebacterium sp. HMSC034E11]